jgi:hypothetical protein
MTADAALTAETPTVTIKNPTGGIKWIPPQAAIEKLAEAIATGDGWPQVVITPTEQVYPFQQTPEYARRQKALYYMQLLLRVRFQEHAPAIAQRFMVGDATKVVPTTEEACMILAALVNPDTTIPRKSKKKRDPNQGALDFSAAINDEHDVADLKTKQATNKILQHYLKFDNRGMACCPFHQDDSPSFNMFESKDEGQFLCGCFGCKWTGNVSQFVAKIESFDRHDANEQCFAILNGEAEPFSGFEESAAKLDAVQPKTRGVYPPKTDEYIYLNENGERSFVVERHEEMIEVDGVLKKRKEFPIFHFLEGMKVKGKPPNEDYGRLLYHLPQLLAAKDAPFVLMAEGEKDAHSAESRGLVAVTNAGGAGNLTAEHVKWLRGLNVVDCAHNDDAGRERSKDLARLGRGVVASLVRVIWPDSCTKGWDLTDHFEGGGTWNDLKFEKVL